MLRVFFSLLVSCLSLHGHCTCPAGVFESSPLSVTTDSQAEIKRNMMVTPLKNKLSQGKPGITSVAPFFTGKHLGIAWLLHHKTHGCVMEHKDICMQFKDETMAFSEILM